MAIYDVKLEIASKEGVYEPHAEDVADILLKILQPRMEVKKIEVMKRDKKIKFRETWFRR